MVTIVQTTSRRAASGPAAAGKSCASIGVVVILRAALPAAFRRGFLSLEDYVCSLRRFRAVCRTSLVLSGAMLADFWRERRRLLRLYVTELRLAVFAPQYSLCYPWP